MAARKCGAPPIAADGSTRRPDCVTAVRTQARAPTQHYAESVARRQRVLTITAWLAVVVTGSFALMQLATGAGGWYIALINVFTAVTFAIVPLLHRFGGLVAPLTFIGTAYVAIFAIGWDVGTDAGAQFFFLVAAALVVLLVGIEHTALAVGLAAVAAGLVIALEFLVPPDTGLQPPWAMSVSFVLTTVSACGVAVATVWFALRDTARAEAVMEAEHDRSEALLANMLPASIAERLKEPERNIIADKYDEASVLFADIVGFTERASSTAPADLVRFLDRLYSAFDELVDQHGLEKIKVSGDSYMVVSGVPRTGVAQVAFAFSLHVSAGGRILLFISGAASLILAVLAFRHFGDAVLLLAIWIGIGFIFRGVATTVSAISDPMLPGRGWSIFVGVISLIAGIVVMASPFESIWILALVVGIWLVVIGTCEIASSFAIRKASQTLG